MINYEEYYEKAHVRAQADACSEARSILCSLSGEWCTASCERIKEKLNSDCSLFVGNDPIRCALVPGSCGSQCGGISDACSQARSILCSLSGEWCNKTCDEIKAKLAADCTLFVGNDPIRCALVPGSCGSQCGAPPPPPDCGTPQFQYNQCVSCEVSQPVYRDACGNYTTGPNQPDGACASFCPPAPPPTNPCQLAKDTLCRMSGTWCNASCQQVEDHVCRQDCTLFVNDPIRQGLCGTLQCSPPPPPPPPQCPAGTYRDAAGNCVPITQPPPTTGNNIALYAASAAAVGVLGVLLAVATSKKKMEV